MTMEKLLTISAFTENRIGMLNRLTIILTRRHLNIESLTVSESEVKVIFRYTIVVKTTMQKARKVIGQMEKLVEVLKAFVHEEDEIIHQEIALYKIKNLALTHGNVEKVIRENHARILSVDPQYLVIEKNRARARDTGPF